MIRIKWLLFFIFPAVLFTACRSSKSIQRQMVGLHSELFYELTTPVYPDDYIDTVYLNPVDYSAMPPYTVVKRKGGLVIPLLIFNIVSDGHEVTLGEGSLEQPFRDFLRDALLAQCNRSSCFTLKVKNDGGVLPDSALVLEITVGKNRTAARMIYNTGAFLNPLAEGYFTSFSSWEIKQPASQLEIFARLMQNGNCLWKKSYTVSQDLSSQRKGIEDDREAYETCIDVMTENLSYTTKGIVENISRDLHLLVLLNHPKP